MRNVFVLVAYHSLSKHVNQWCFQGYPAALGFLVNEVVHHWKNCYKDNYTFQIHMYSQSGGFCALLTSGPEISSDGPIKKIQFWSFTFEY